MENDKLRMFMFATICALCFAWMMIGQSPSKKPSADTVGVANNDVGNKTTEPEEVASKEVSPSKPAEEKKEDVIEEPKVDYGIENTLEVEEKIVVVENGVIRVEFSNHGCVAKKIVLLNYDKTYEKDSGAYELLIPVEGSAWSETFALEGWGNLFSKASFELVLEKTSNGQRLIGRSVKKGIEVVKTFEFYDGFYDFDFKLKVINHQPEEIACDVAFVGAVNLEYNLKNIHSVYNDQITSLINDNGEFISAGDIHWISKTYGARQGVMTLADEPFVMGPERKSGIEYDNAKLIWAALKNRYFTLIVKPDSENWTVRGANVNKNMKTPYDIVPSMSFELVSPKLAKGQSYEGAFKIFAGPTKTDVLHLERYEKEQFIEVVDYGFMFPRFIKIFDGILNFIIYLIGPSNYWLGIILLTVLVRLCMFPITRKSSLSQAKLQSVAPKMKELREKHKGNPQKLNQEMMKLYREEGVNPFSSCLPVFIQMPIFIGLYWTFTLTFEVRFKSFLWINDLADADHLIHLGGHIPLIGEYFNLLPILYAVINFMHMSSMPAPQDEMQIQQQKIMKFMFPVMMLFFFYSMPSALVLYFIVSGIWSIVEQKAIKKKVEAFKVAMNK